MTLGNPIDDTAQKEPPTVQTDIVENPPSPTPAPVPTPVPTPKQEPSEDKDKDPMKGDCMYCKAENIARLSFMFGLSVLILAFSFKLVKTAK